MSKKSRLKALDQSTGTPMTTPETTIDPSLEETLTPEEAAALVEEATQDAAAEKHAEEVTTPVVETPAPTEAPLEATQAPVETPAPEAEGTAPSATSMGTIVEPTPPINVGALLREKSTFEQAIDDIIAKGSVTLQTVAGALRDYDQAMGSTAAIDTATINLQQGTLWRVIRMVLNSGEDFEGGLNLIIAFIREGKAGAFSDANLFRGFEHTRLNGDHSKAFQSILTLLNVAASVNNRTNVRKAIDLGRTMTSDVFTPEARTRVLGFFA